MLTHDLLEDVTNPFFFWSLLLSGKGWNGQGGPQIHTACFTQHY